MLPYVIYKSRTAGKDFIMTEGETSAVFWDLNKIYLKNKIFSFRQLLGRHGFESHQHLVNPATFMDSEVHGRRGCVLMCNAFVNSY